MAQRDLTKEIMYEGVKTLLEAETDHIHLSQQKLYTLYSLAFNYFLYLSGKDPGHYIIRIQDSYLLEKLIRKSKDTASRKFLQKMSLPRKLKYGNSTFHIDFFNFATWSNTNDIPKEKIKGALVVKNTNQAPMGQDFADDDEEVQATIKALPENYYLHFLREFVPKTIIIAFDESIEASTEIKFPFIKEEDQQMAKGVSIAADVVIDDTDY